MKKIGIVTMVGYDNYGNLFQNYAVKKILENLGYYAYTLNNNIQEKKVEQKESIVSKFSPTYIIAYIKTQLSRYFGCKNSKDFSPRGLFRSIVNYKSFNMSKNDRLEKMKIFRDLYIPYDSKLINTSDFSQEEYVAFVCGSDVVWHPTYHVDKTNDFLGFAPKYKRVALAPSFGVSKLPKSREKDYFNWINGIEYLSVRETSGAEIIKKLTNREAVVLCDPTIAVDVDDWKQLQSRPKNAPERKYALCYFLGNKTKEYDKWINSCTKDKSYELVEIIDSNDLKHYATDPCEMLWLIDNAEVVFTDSFHAVVFSILFHTPFVAFKRIEKGLELFSRIQSLLNLMDLQNREFSVIEREQFDKLDFSYSDKVISEEKIKIKMYLTNALSNIEEISMNN